MLNLQRLLILLLLIGSGLGYMEYKEYRVAYNNSLETIYWKVQRINYLENQVALLKEALIKP